MNTNYVPVAATFSKNASFYGGAFPFKYILAGDGAYVQGDDGTWYIDWVSGLGANLVGYANTALNQHLWRCLSHGNGFSLPTKLEYSVAEKLCLMLNAHVPGWANQQLQVRWVTSGSDACNAAIRLARAALGKKVVLSAGYHGFADQFVVMTEPHHGIPNMCGAFMEPFTWGDMTSLAQWDGYKDLAAVIFEQGIVEPTPEYYTELRAFCDRNQCLLIADEVVTGLRYGLGGACEKYGIQPDLICMGKGLSAGHALAALIAPVAYMQWFSRVDPVFISSTNAGNVGGLAAADWLLDNFTTSSVAALEHTGNELMHGLTDVGVKVIGHPVRSLLQFDNDYARAYFITRMAQRKIIMNRPNFPTTAHINFHVAKTIAEAGQIMREIQAYEPQDLQQLLESEGMPFVLFRNR